MTQITEKTRSSWISRVGFAAALTAGLFASFSTAPQAQAEVDPTAEPMFLVSLSFDADISLAGQPATVVDNFGNAVAQTVIMPGTNHVTVPNTGASAWFVVTPNGGNILDAVRGWDDHDTGDI